MHQMHDTLPMHDSVLEEVIPALPPTAPLELVRAKILKLLRRIFLLLLRPLGLVDQEFHQRSMWISC